MNFLTQVTFIEIHKFDGEFYILIMMIRVDFNIQGLKSIW